MAKTNGRDQRRFLITRLSAVGDCIHTMPLVGALRRRFPNAYIAWAVQRSASSLLEGYPGLDRTIVVPRDWLKSLRTIRQLRNELRAEQFNTCLDPQGLTKSALLGWLSGAPQRIGFTAPQGRELSLWLNNVRVAPTAEHVVDRYLQLLQPLGSSEQPAAHFELPRWESPTIDALIRNTHLTGGFAVLNPGAGWDSKTWPARRFGQLARELGERHNLPSVVAWAGEREKGWAVEIVERAGGNAWLAPSTSLQELATLLRKARLCVAGDTGPLHLAAAVGTPCVGLYGTTRPERSGAYGPEHLRVQAFYQSGTSRQRRRAPNLAMQAIDVSMVLAACEQLLSRAAGRSTHAA